jgi:hypothetical protein
MKNKNVFWGVLLVVIGLLFIFNNLGWLNFSFRDLFDLWPALLVVWGISILPIKAGLKTILSIVVIVIAILIGSTRSYDHHWSPKFHRYTLFHNTNWNNNSDDENADKISTYTFFEDYNTKIKSALLNMDIAAGKFRIEDSTNYLIDFNAENNLGHYTKEIMKNGNTTEIYVTLEEGHIHSGTNKNRAHIMLNTAPLWSLKLDIGAADFIGDLRHYKVEKVEIDGGASSIRLKIGNKQKKTNVDIEAGASSVKVYIPESAGCEVTSNTVLSELGLKGFVKDDNVYRTPDFKNKKQKVYISLDAAISSLNIIRE